MFFFSHTREAASSSLVARRRVRPFPSPGERTCMPAAPPVRLTLSQRVRKHCVRRMCVAANLGRGQGANCAVVGREALARAHLSRGLAGAQVAGAKPRNRTPVGLAGMASKMDRIDETQCPDYKTRCATRVACAVSVCVWPALWSDGSAAAWQIAGLLLTPDPLCRKKLIDSEEEYSKLTGKKPGLRQWLALKNRQYNVTSALYMLDW